MNSERLNNWYKTCFRRLLVDMHIPDWNDAFLKDLDPKKYADTILGGNIRSTMLYCNSHVGLALYPSKLGPVHSALGKTDFVGEVLGRCHRKKVAVVAYYSAIFNNASFLENPDWRILPRGEGDVYESSRYGVCCPNSPYRDFAIAQTEELCAKYPFDGIFFDMLFWPYICYCPHCQEKFRKEEGKDLPTTINWNDPTWMAFQRARERWMNEMAGDLTAAVNRARPSMTVTHQMSPVLHDWRMGMPFSLTQHCDYTSGDFYGPAIQQSLVCKLFASISRRKPFEFHTSRCLDLRDHVTMKTVNRMETQASLAPAHASAFMFIDAIETDGTLNRGVYKRIKDIFSRSAPYEKFLGGELAADVALYMSSESRFDFRESGLDSSVYTKQADNMASLFTVPHLDAVKGAAKALQEAHIPYAVVTRDHLAQLGKYKLIFLPNVLVMGDEEIKAFAEYVKNGGAIYASGYSSLVDLNGKVRKNFGLGDVFGISGNQMMKHELAFLSPSDSKLGKWIAPQEHAIHKGGWIPVKATTAKTLATLTLPWYPENKGTVYKPSFSSIHSTPQGPTGTAPAITWNRFGKGRACYALGAIEAEAQEISRKIVIQLARQLLGTSVQVEATAPSFIEITVFDKPDEQKANISLVSLRDGEDCIPCEGTVRVRQDTSRRIKAVRLLPDRKKVPFRKSGKGIEFDFKNFRIFSMFEVDYSAR